MTTIEVKQHHIDVGTVSCSHCPVALAINHYLDGDEGLYASVTRNGITIKKRRSHHPNESDYHYFDTPSEVIAFTREFDIGLKMKPFSFELPLEEMS